MPSTSPTAAAVAAANEARRRRAAERAAADPELRARAVRVVRAALSSGSLDVRDLVAPERGVVEHRGEGPGVSGAR